MSDKIQSVCESLMLKSWFSNRDTQRFYIYERQICDSLINPDDRYFIGKVFCWPTTSFSELNSKLSVMKETAKLLHQHHVTAVWFREVGDLRGATRRRRCGKAAPGGADVREHGECGAIVLPSLGPVISIGNPLTSFNTSGRRSSRSSLAWISTVHLGGDYV